MARIRSIKPEFWADEKIAGLPLEARLLFIGLWSFADDEGRMRANPVFVQAQVFPYDRRIDVTSLLGVLAEASLTIPYVIDGQSYLQIRNWKRHQRIDKPTKSQLPEPPPNSPRPPAGSGSAPRVLVEDSGSPPGGKGEEGKGEEGNLEALSGSSPTTPEPLALVPPEPKRDEAREVFAYWVKAAKKPPTALFSPERRRKVEGRLQDFTVDQLCRAIDGCLSTPHNRGENETGTKYDDLELICRTVANVERFIEAATRPAQPRPSPGSRPGAHVVHQDSPEPRIPGRKLI